MSDDRLFASNNAIGRKWYFINLFILAVVSFFTNLVFTDYIIPNVITEVYSLIAKGILYFLFLIYLITFFALIDRRLYDVFGTREVKGYKNISGFLSFVVIFQLLVIICKWKAVAVPIPIEILEACAAVLDLLFMFIIFVLGFFKGKISNLTYEQYRKKIKYE